MKKDDSRLDMINLLAKRYIKHLTDIFSEDDKAVLRNILVEGSPEYEFGFTGFKSSSENTWWGGQVLVALTRGRFEADHRYFAVNLSMSPRPFEYLRGARFEFREYEQWDPHKTYPDAVCKAIERSIISLKSYILGMIDYE